jgi:hypothetical protein
MTKPAITGIAGLLLASLCGLTACTGSSATVALRPDFEITTPSGIATVSVREAPPGMADDRFTRMIEMGMDRAKPGSVVVAAAQAPYPAHRIVWHVKPAPPRGMSRVTVNSFNGLNPFAFEQETVANEASESEIVSTVEMMTRRLAAADNRDDWGDARAGGPDKVAKTRPTPSPAAS